MSMGETNSEHVYRLAFWHRLWTNWIEIRKKLRIKNVNDFIRRLESGSFNLNLIESLIKPTEDDITFIMKLLSQGISIIPITDDAYPQNLKSLDDGEIYPPLVIYCKGSLDILKAEKCIAIVGTRFCTNWGREVTRRLVKAIYDRIHDAIIVTGLARGIDTEATKTALDYDLRTIAVLPWLKPIYPPENRDLAKMIIKKGGVLISERINEPISLSERRRQLYLRNRIISALSNVVIVIEARLHYIGNGKYSGGAMWQVEYALKRGKPVFVLEPKYKAFRRGRIWVNYRKAFEEFVRHGAQPFKEDQIEKVVGEIVNLMGRY